MSKCSSDSDATHLLLTTISGGDAGGKKEERDKEERVAEEGGEWDDGPPGTLLEWPSRPNLSLYFRKQRGRCRIREDSGDRQSDARPLADLMNKISTSPQCLLQGMRQGPAGETKGSQNEHGVTHGGGGVALLEACVNHNQKLL